MGGVDDESSDLSGGLFFHIILFDPLVWIGPEMKSRLKSMSIKHPIVVV